MSAKAKSMFCRDFPSLSRRGEWVSKLNLSSFLLKSFFKFVLAWLAREKQNILTYSQPLSQPYLHKLMKHANQSVRSVLVIL